MDEGWPEDYHWSGKLMFRSDLRSNISCNNKIYNRFEDDQIFPHLSSFGHCSMDDDDMIAVTDQLETIPGIHQQCT